MAKVMAVLKVYPKDIDVNLDNVVNELNMKLAGSRYQLIRSEKEYVAFGLYVLRVYVVMPEEVEGGTEELEDLIRSINGVENAETEFVTRLSE